MIRTSRVVAAAVAVAGALALTACSPSEAGAAAVVGDRRITVAQVQAGYKDIVPLVGQDQQITQTDVLNWLILEPYLVQAAAGIGRGVSTHDAELQFTDANSAAAATAKPTGAGIDVVRANLANVQLQSGRPQAEVAASFNQIGSRLKQEGVHINPRYGGSIDYTNFTILGVKQDWLKTSGGAVAATPAPAPAATP